MEHLPMKKLKPYVVTTGLHPVNFFYTSNSRSAGFNSTFHIRARCLAVNLDLIVDSFICLLIWRTITGRFMCRVYMMNTSRPFPHNLHLPHSTCRGRQDPWWWVPSAPILSQSPSPHGNSWNSDLVNLCSELHHYGPITSIEFARAHGANGVLPLEIGVRIVSCWSPEEECACQFPHIY